MRRPLVWLIGVVLVLGGCASARPAAAPPVAETPPPPPPSTETAPPVTKEPPAATEPGPLKPGCLEDGKWPGYPSAAVDSRQGHWVRTGTCKLEIAEEPVTVTFTVPAAVGEKGAREGLRTTLREEPYVQVTQVGSYFEVRAYVGAGKPGERFAVRWQGEAEGQKLDLGLELQRRPSPRVTAEVRLGTGPWQPLRETLVTAPGPLAIRFQLHNQVSLPAVQGRIAVALQGVPSEVQEWIPNTVEVRVKEPPSLLRFDFRGVEGAYGAVPDNGFVVYAGERPKLVTLDPSSGKETVVGYLPPDIRGADLSPDGEWALLYGMGPNHEWEDQIWVLNTRTGQTHLTPFREGYFSRQARWLGGNAVLGAPRRMQIWDLAGGTGSVVDSKAASWGPVSANGRYVAGFVADMDREDPATFLAPASVVIFDLESRTERVYRDAVKVRIPHSEAPIVLPMRWVGDGLVLGQYAGHDSEKSAARWEYLRLERESGRVTAYAGAEVPAISQYRPWTPGPAGWQLYQAGIWGEVKLKGPDGAEVIRGNGLPLGWSADGKLLICRWNPAQRRHRYGL